MMFFVVVLALRFVIKLRFPNDVPDLIFRQHKIAVCLQRMMGDNSSLISESLSRMNNIAIISDMYLVVDSLANQKFKV